MNSTSFLPLLAELLIKSGVILLAAALADRVWRRASAAQRHGLWLAAFAALLLLPATRLIAPHWSFARPQPTKVHVRIASEPASATSSTSEPAAAPVAAMPAPVRSSWVPWVSWDLWDSWLSRLDCSALATYFWLAGAAAMLGRRALGTVRLRAMRRASAPASDAQLAHARRIAAEFGVTRPVAVRVSRARRVPLTWGTWHPILMLPEDCAAWPDDRLFAALRHELAHIRRGDFAVRLLADLVRAFYWPNPLMWLASRALRSAQEQACDDLVLNAGTCPTDYATLLCDAARRFTAPHGAVAMAQPSTLESRIRAIVDATRDRRPLTWPVMLLGSLLVALALAASTAAQLRATEPAPAASEAVALEPATPADAPASPVEAATADQKPRIEIVTGLLEYFPTEEETAAVTKFWAGAKMGENLAMARVLSRSDAPITFGKHFNLLYNKTLTTGSGQLAVSDVVMDELRSPTEWEKGTATGAWKPTKFETRKCGLKIEAKPAVQPDGTIDLDLVAQLNAFKEFIDKDTGRSLPAGDDPAAEGPRRQAVIASRKITTSVALKGGDEMVIDLSAPGSINPFTKDVSKGRIVLFVRADVAPPVGEKAAAPSALAPSPASPAPVATPSLPKPAPPAPASAVPGQAEIEAKFVQLTAALSAPIVIAQPSEPAAGERAIGPDAIHPNSIDALLFGLTSAPKPTADTPNGKKIPLPVPKPERLWIKIEARFFQVTPVNLQFNPLLEKWSPISRGGFSWQSFGGQSPSSVGNLDAPLQSFVADALKKKNVVDLFSVPKVSTSAGQRVVIEIVGEHRYAVEWKKGATRGTWKPTAFETRNTGITLEAEPTLQADGTIALNLTPQIVDFLGFENLDTGKPMPPGTEDTIPQYWPTSVRSRLYPKGPTPHWTTSAERQAADDSIPEGPRLRAVFSDFKLVTKRVLKSGETVKLDGLKQVDDVKPFADRVRKGSAAVFITASVVDPSGNPLPAAK